ncbi:MAG: Hcp family type VI secretion system effector [Gemmatimonadota bacterium]
MRSLILVSLAFLSATASLRAQDRVAVRGEDSPARDVFLKIQDIEGESQDKDRKGWIELESWSWGAESPTGRAALLVTPATFPPPAGTSDITLKRGTTAATPKLYEFCAKGKILKSVELARRDTDGRLHAYVLENARITFYSVSNPTGSAPIETMSFNFEKIDYRPPRNAQDR